MQPAAFGSTGTDLGIPMPKKRKKDQPPEKWTAPIVGYPIFDKDGKIVEHEDLAGLTREQKKNIIENMEYFRSIRSDDSE